MGVFEVALALYGLAAAAYIRLVFAKTAERGRLPGFFARFGWIVHSVGLMGHVPAAGTFEALLFFTWALMAAQIFMEQRFEWRGTGLFSASLAAIGLLMAGFLIPSEPFNSLLQNRWIWVHVTAGALSYAFFLISAFASVFFLIKEKIRTDFALTAVSIFSVVTLMGYFGPLEALLPRKIGFWTLGLALAGFLIHLGLVAISIGLERRAALALRNAARIAAARQKLGLRSLQVVPPQSPRQRLGYVSRWVFGGAWMALLVMTAFLFVTPTVYFYFVALVLLVGAGGFLLLLVLFRERVEDRLPESDRLDLWSFQSALYGFPLLTINLVSGSIWAYDAWGNAWSWESKTTWAVITWLFYAVYLRLQRGKKKTALVALFGFFVIAMTFLANSGQHFFLK